MKVLILGGQGMLGHKLLQTLGPQLETYATFRSKAQEWSPFSTITDSSKIISGVNAQQTDTVIAALAKTRPDVIINCIGVVKQLEAAKNPIISLEVNALFPHRLAQLCRAMGTRLLHISTDCVFSGQRGRYTEDDMPDPVDLYGRTKLLGELDQPGCLTLRTSIIGRELTRQTGLLEWLFSNQNRRIQGYTQAIYTGLTTQTLSTIIQQILVERPDLSGLYHVASQPISKYDLLQKINQQMKLNIQITPEDQFFCDRSLLGNRFTQQTGISIPTWDEMITDLIADSTPYEQWNKSHDQT